MSKVLTAIRPNANAVMVDCRNCHGREFQVHVMVEVNGVDARLTEVACTKCGHAYPVEYGFLGGKLNNHGPKGVDIPVPTHAFNRSN